MHHLVGYATVLKHFLRHRLYNTYNIYVRLHCISHPSWGHNTTNCREAKLWTMIVLEIVDGPAQPVRVNGNLWGGGGGALRSGMHTGDSL